MVVAGEAVETALAAVGFGLESEKVFLMSRGR